MNPKLQRRTPVSGRVSSSIEEEIDDADHADELAMSSSQSTWPRRHLGAAIASPEIDLYAHVTGDPSEP
jgi:hypothetical protein